MAKIIFKHIQKHQFQILASQKRDTSKKYFTSIKTNGTKEITEFLFGQPYRS